jgi:LPXTG-motif cell wall-anchored protein
MSYHGLGKEASLPSSGSGGTTVETRTASVSSIQCALRAAGVSSIAVDGKFGANTRSALLAQQRSYLPAMIGLLFEDARTGATTISINKTFYEWLMKPSPSCRTASADRSTPATTSDKTTEEPTGEQTEEPGGGGPAAWKTWVPVGGAVVLLGLGVFFLRKRRG